MKSFRLAAALSMVLTVVFISGIIADDLPELRFEKYTLPNGLDVILHEDHSIPIVSVNVMYHVGSKNEKPGRTGFAHLFEHMMFQGSEHHDVLFDEDIDVYGGTNNGSTGMDRTNYWENMPSNYLKKALWLEADRMGYLLPAMTDERLENQRNVVMNEKRQNYDDAPYGSARETIHKMMYPAAHPYSWITIGLMEDLEAATREDVENFFKTYYTPNNASLCIAGDFDPAEAKQWVAEFFGPIPPGPAVNRMKHWVPEVNEEIRSILEDRNITMPRLYMAWHTPPFYAPGDAEFDLLASVLSGGKSSRLYKALVYDNQIAQDVAAYQSSMEIGSLYQIVVTAKEGHTLEEIETKVDAILADLLAEGITPDEFERARTNWESRFVRRLENVGGFGGRSDLLNSYNTMLGDPGMLLWDKNRYSQATIDGVMGYARRYLKPDARMVLYVEPLGQLAAAEDGADMSINPPPAAEPSFTPPMIQQATLDNGMELYLVENHDLPLVQMNLLIKSGWAADPADRPASGSLTAELLNEGTKTRNALEISEELQRLGANFGIGSGWDNTDINLNILRKKLDDGLALMADIIINPTFPQEELDRQKQIYLGRIQQESTRALTTAFKSFLSELYGADHPYGQPYTGSGTVESITAISRQDIVDYYRANYLPNNTAAIVVGDITLDEAKKKLEKAFKDWKRGTVTQATVAPVAPLDKTKIYIIDKPGATQSSIIIGNLTGNRRDPDYVSATVATTVLGGGGTGRLYSNLRQDKGYTYGAYSFLSDRVGQGAFVCYSQVQGEFTRESLIEFMKEIRGITGEIPMTDKELTDGRNGITMGYPQNFQTVAGIADQLNTLVAYDLPLDRWSTYIDQVNAIDHARALAAANKYIHPDALLIMIVGDRAKIEAEIRELNLGEIILSSAE